MSREKRSLTNEGRHRQEEQPVAKTLHLGQSLGGQPTPPTTTSIWQTARWLPGENRTTQGQTLSCPGPQPYTAALIRSIRGCPHTRRPLIAARFDHVD